MKVFIIKRDSVKLRKKKLQSQIIPQGNHSTTRTVISFPQEDQQSLSQAAVANVSESLSYSMEVLARLLIWLLLIHLLFFRLFPILSVATSNG